LFIYKLFPPAGDAKPAVSSLKLDNYLTGQTHEKYVIATKNIRELKG
jgi:hypothetical protein